MVSIFTYHILARRAAGSQAVKGGLQVPDVSVLKDPVSFLRANKHHVIACLGYALFLATNATVVWGGVFPFLPESVQVEGFVTVFFVAQSLAFAVCFFASACDVYFNSERVWANTIRSAVVSCLSGWTFLIASIYVPGHMMLLGCLAGCLIGFGVAAFNVAWQRVFASEKAGIGNRNLIIGTLIAPVIYFALFVIPVAITTFLIPLVFMPVYTLCIVLSWRDVDRSQGMLSDSPRSHPEASKQLLKDYWRSAVSIGALAFSCGIARSLALERASAALVVNSVSMVALLLGAAAVLFVWQSRPLRISITMFFRVFFPFAVTAFFLLPVFGDSLLVGLAGALYALYVCATVLVMAQCSQASHDRGINPTFVYGWVAGIVYLLHDIGFLAGMVAGDVKLFGMDPYTTISFVAMYLLALMFFVVQGGFKAALSPSRIQADKIELMLSGATATRNRASAGVAVDKAPERVRDDSPYLDRVSKQCLLLARQYKLSARETEVAEAMARGDTIPGVAATLGLSENTVRTHIKRIYAKVDVHKKQELLDLIRSFDPAALVDNDPDRFHPKS